MYRVLIVDDDRVAAEVTHMLFPWEELNITSIKQVLTTTGLVERILREQPDIVFIDIEMGNVSGLDIIKECKENNCPTMFIIVSGHDNFDYAQTAVNLGAIHYLLKPIDSDDVNILTKKLKKLLSSSDTNGFVQTENFSHQREEATSETWNKIVRYIEENYSKKIQAQDICSMFYISIRTLYNLSVANTGKSFAEYLTHFRISKAKNLLITTSMSIAEIADAIGIKDHYYFIKVFKKHLGITPIKFREENGILNDQH